MPTYTFTKTIRCTFVVEAENEDAAYTIAEDTDCYADAVDRDDSEEFELQKVQD